MNGLRAKRKQSGKGEGAGTCRLFFSEAGGEELRFVIYA